MMGLRIIMLDHTIVYGSLLACFPANFELLLMALLWRYTSKDTLWIHITIFQVVDNVIGLKYYMLI